jgi:hypothetical protein
MANTGLAMMLKGMGINPEAISQMGAGIGETFKKLADAAERHTAALERIEGKINAVMDRLNIHRELTVEEYEAAAEASAAYILRLEAVVNDGAVISRGNFRNLDQEGLVHE